MIIKTEWYSLLAHVEGQDILFDICGYMAEECVRFGWARCLLGLTGYFIQYTSPQTPFRPWPKKGALCCVRTIMNYSPDGYVPLLPQSNRYIVEVTVTPHVSSSSYVGYRNITCPPL